MISNNAEPALTTPRRPGRRSGDRPRRWTADEDLVVRYHYPRLPLDDLAGALGRNAQAVRRRANNLGVTLGTRSPLVRTPAAKRPWSAADDDTLRESWGLVAPATIAGQLGRSVISVKVRKKRLGLTFGANVWTSRLIARLFGVDSHLVIAWIAGGLLAARRAPVSYGAHRLWHITYDALEAFIRDHPAAYPVDRMQPGFWHDLACQVRARDPLLTVPEMARHCGVSTACVLQNLRRRRLPGMRGFGANNPWYIRASDARRFRPARPELVGHRGRNWQQREST